MTANADAGRWFTLLEPVSRIAAVIALWLQKRKQIGDLRELSDDQLWDIGLSRGDVHQVSAGSFWDYRKPHR